MRDEPPVRDTTPLGVRTGRAMSSLAVFPWPFLCIAAVVALRDAPTNPALTCVSSWWGAFVCTSLLYPILMIGAFLLSRWALPRGRLWLAATASWAPLALLLLFAWAGGAVARLVPAGWW